MAFIESRLQPSIRAVLVGKPDMHPVRMQAENQIGATMPAMADVK